MKIKTLTKTTLITLLFMMLFSCCAFAANSYNSSTISEISNNTISANDDEMSYGAENYGLKNVTIDEASSWFDRKGFEVVGFLQKVIQPFAIIVFIVCAFLILFGNVQTGTIGAGISLIIYVVVLYAPEIFNWFLNWVRT